MRQRTKVSKERANNWGASQVARRASSCVAASQRVNKAAATLGGESGRHPEFGSERSGSKWLPARLHTSLLYFLLPSAGN